MLFNLLGKDVPDLDEKLSEIAIHNKQQAELRTYAEEINNSIGELAKRLDVPEERKFTGFDGYKKAIAK